MALEQGNFVGFESGDFSECAAFTGTIAAQGDFVNSGSYALKIPSGDFGTCDINPFLHTTDGGDKYIIGFVVLFSDTTPSEAIEFLRPYDNTTQFFLRLRLATDGDLELLNAGGTPSVVGTASTPFTDNKKHLVEVYFENVDSGVCEVFVDGTQVITVSAQDFHNASGDYNTIQIGKHSTATSDVYIDDVYCLSGATAASDRLGAIGIFAYKHDKTGATPDGGSGGTAGADLDTDTWAETIDAGVSADNGSGEYRDVGDRGTVDWNGPAKLGISVDAGSFFADTSDAGPTDNDGVWTDDANIFDGDITAVGSTGVAGSRTTNELRGAGTNIPGTGDSFTNVKVRMFGNTTLASSTGNVEIFTDGEGELLGTIVIENTSVRRWTPWQQLTVPSGGWTRAKAQALEFILFATGASGMQCLSIELMTTNPVANDADILATKAHFKLDRDGGGGTTHIIGLSHSGDGNNPTEFDDDTDWGPVTTTPTFHSVIQTTSAKLPSTTQNIRAGFGTLGAQDIHMYDGYVMLLHKPPAVSTDDITATDPMTFGETADINAPTDIVVTDDPMIMGETADISAVGELSATSAMATAETTTDLDAVGELVVTDDNAAFAETPDINAPGTLVLTDPMVFGEITVNLESGISDDIAVTDPMIMGETANINAIGELTLTATLVAGETPNINAPGTLALTDPTVFSETANLDGPFDLTVTDPMVFAEINATLNALGELTLTATLVAGETANINALTDITSTATLVAAETTADLDAVGELRVTDPMIFAETNATLNALGELTITATMIYGETADISAIGTLALTDPMAFAETTADLTGAALQDVTATSNAIFGDLATPSNTRGLFFVSEEVSTKGTTGDLTAVLPSFSDGDLAIAIVSRKGTVFTAAALWTGPAGWTREDAHVTQSRVQDLSTAIFTRVLQSGDGNPVFTPNESRGTSGAVITVWKNPDKLVQIDVAVAFLEEAGFGDETQSPDNPANTPVSENTEFLVFGSLSGTQNNLTWNAPANYRLRGATVGPGENVDTSCAVAHIHKGVPELVSPTAWLNTGGAGAHVQHTYAVVLRPTGDDLAATATAVFGHAADLTAPFIQDMTATATAVFAETANINALTDITATATLVYGETADINAIGTLALTDPAVFGETANINSPVDLTVTDPAIFGEAANLDGPFDLTVTDPMVFSETNATLNALGELTLTATLVAGHTAGINAPGTLSLTDPAIFGETADINSPLNLAVTDSMVFAETTATLNALGELRLTSTFVVGETANVNATGTLALTDPAVFGETAALTGPSAGSLTVTDPMVFAETNATLNALGELTLTATLVTSEAANISAVGTLSLTDPVIFGEAADLTVSADMTLTSLLAFAEANATLNALGEMRLTSLMTFGQSAKIRGPATQWNPDPAETGDWTPDAAPAGSWTAESTLSKTWTEESGL